MNVGRRRTLAWLHFVLAWSSSSWAGADGPTPQLPRRQTEITLAGPAMPSAGVKEVVAELLARDRVKVTWRSQAFFQPRDIFDARSAVGVMAWIDLSAPAEARLYFRDGVTDRFYLRALAIPDGVDEMAKEEIAHVVSNAVLALSQGTGETLTRSEARQALQLQAGREDEQPLRAPSAPLRFTVGVLGGAQRLASDVPVAATGTLSLALARAPQSKNGAFGFWLDLGGQLPARYQGRSVGADVQALSARVGASWEIGRTVRVRLGIGGGADRYRYEPQGDPGEVALAAAGSFYVPVLAGWIGMDLALLEHLALTLRGSADAPLAKIHFDVRDRNGQATCVLSAYPIIPAVSLGLSLVF